jgi:hypothetical protein
MGDGGSENVMGPVRSSSEGRGSTVLFPPSDLDPNYLPSSELEAKSSLIQTGLLYFSLQTFLHPPPYPLSPGKPSQDPGIRVFSSLSCPLLFQTRTASRSTRCRPSSEMVRCFPPESTQTQYELNPSVLCPRGFRPGLIISQMNSRFTSQPRR